MEKSVIQGKCGLMLNIDAGVKSIKYVKKFIFGILPHVVVEMVNI